MEPNEKITQGQARIKKAAADLTENEEARDQAEGEETRSKASEAIADIREKATEKADQLIGKLKK
jgi:hypothetical protein